ncbi:hypothetical protein [Geopseudomonas aromaticivorans]
MSALDHAGGQQDFQKVGQGLADIANAYGFYLNATGDKSQAMRLSCKAAIRMGCKPVALWTNRAIYFGHRKSPAMAFSKEDCPHYKVVLIGGVAPEVSLDVRFDPASGTPGWVILEEADVQHYEQWGMEIDADEPIYAPFAKLHAERSREARLMMDLEEERKRSQELEQANQALLEMLKSMGG